MDGSLVIMEGSLSLWFLLLQWMVALFLWKVVCCLDFCSIMYVILVIMEGSLLSRFLLLQWMVAFLLMEGSFLSRSLLLKWMVALSLWKVVC